MKEAAVSTTEGAPTETIAQTEAETVEQLVLGAEQSMQGTRNKMVHRELNPGLHGENVKS